MSGAAAASGTVALPESIATRLSAAAWTRRSVPGRTAGDALDARDTVANDKPVSVRSAEPWCVARASHPPPASASRRQFIWSAK